MEQCHARSADRARELIEAGAHDRHAFREALLAVPTRSRDAWLDRVLGLGEPPADGPELPRGCVPYIPCSVAALLEVVDRAEIGPADVFVDVGSGVGRAMALVHLLTDASVIGIEIQSELVEAARDLARLVSMRVASVHGDAALLAGYIAVGSVFFFYCPFGGARLQHVLDELEGIAKTRPIRVCCVDVAMPECAWLAREASPTENVAIYRSA